jgi:hypothetical protein
LKEKKRNGEKTFRRLKRKAHTLEETKELRKVKLSSLK